MDPIVLVVRPGGPHCPCGTSRRTLLSLWHVQQHVQILIYRYLDRKPLILSSRACNRQSDTLSTNRCSRGHNEHLYRSNSYLETLWDVREGHWDPIWDPFGRTRRTLGCLDTCIWTYLRPYMGSQMGSYLGHIWWPYIDLYIIVL